MEYGGYYDTVVVGAGIVGIATARELARWGQTVLLLEEKAGIGEETSSRNSEVIHAGIYYKPGTLKAKACLQGSKLLYDFAEKRHIPHKNCRKLIVATNSREVRTLEALLANGEKNGLVGLEILSQREARACEENLSCHSALLVPSSGMIDTHQLMLALLADAENDGAVLATSAPVLRTEVIANGFVLDIGGVHEARVSCGRLFNAAGMGAQSLAHNIDGFDRKIIPPLYAVKGNYFSLCGAAPFSHLIYPPPVTGSSGRHYRCDFGGQAIIGPDTEWLGMINYKNKAPEYFVFANTETPDRLIQINDQQAWQQRAHYRVDPGRKEDFVRSILSYYPQLNPNKLEPGYAGIRPKLGITSQDNSDFIIMDETIHGIPGLVCFFGIESPGLTSSLYLAQIAAAKLDQVVPYDPRERISPQEYGFLPKLAL